MRKTWTLALAVALAAFLGGCDDDDCWDDDCDPDSFVAQTLSDQPADGDILFIPPDSYTVSQADETGSLLFGLDPDSGGEYRAFLDFPLDGRNGGDPVPLEAEILRADIDVCVWDVVSDFDYFPTELELVPFPIFSGLESEYFDRPPEATRAPVDFFLDDEGHCFPIDVTSLMGAAQLRGDTDLQLRFLVPEGAGIVELYDGADVNLSPLLTVEFR